MRIKRQTAFRIGQTRNADVDGYAVHWRREKIDDMITRKQLLNDQAVSQSENWITEMSTDELRELFTLRSKQRLKG